MTSSIITQISLLFANRFRVTVLLLIATLGLGFLSYTSFLNREGFPEVQTPFAIIQVPYFVGDKDIVNQDITTPIEVGIADIPEVKEISSTTTDNFAVIVAEFDSGLSSDEGIGIIRDKIDQDVKLPVDTEINYQEIAAAKFLGEYDLLISITTEDYDIDRLEKANLIAEKLSKITGVITAEAVELISSQKNPITGEEFEFQDSYNRLGVKREDGIEFSDAISIGVVKKESKQVDELSTDVREQVQLLKDEGELDGVYVEYVGDFGEDIDTQIGSLETSALGGLIAVIIILFFFINWRASFIGALFIPTVFAATFVGLYLIGYTLNVISLFALILVLGLFVDDAIVVIEAIDSKRKLGKKRLEAVKEALDEIGVADVIGTLTTVLVFLPMAFTTGILGEFIRPIPITVVLALVLSLVIAITFVPLLSSTFLYIFNKKSGKKPNRFIRILDLLFNSFERGLSKLADYDSKFVAKYLSKKWATALVILATFGIVGFGGYFASLISFSVFPSPKDTEDMLVTVDFTAGTTIEEAQELSKDVEQIILDEAEEEIVSAYYLDADENSAIIRISLTGINDREIKSTEIVDELQSRFDSINAYNAKAGILSAGPPTDDYPFATQVFSDDPELLLATAEDVRTFLEQQQVDDEKIVEEVVIENIDTISKSDKKRFINIKAKTTDIENTGLLITLTERLEQEYDAEKLASLGLEEDALGFDLGQQGDNLESFNSTIFAFIAALLVMYGILVFLYNSYSQPLLIFLAIPLTFPLLFPGLFLTGNDLSFFVTLGMMGLAGIVVNNTIVLIEYANQNRRAGQGIRDAITNSVRARFRPIMTTSVTTVAGLLPLALADPFWEALALSIIFGVISSSIMVLITFPAFYAVVEKMRVWRDGVFKKNKE